MTSRIKVYVDTFGWFFRQTNTDVNYMKSLARLSEHIPVDFIYPKNHQDDLKENIQYIWQRLRPYKTKQDTASLCRSLPLKTLRESGADVIINHRKYPLNVTDFPVIWQYAILDPAMQINRGATHKTIETAYAHAEPLFDKAAVVHVSTPAEVLRHRARFPDLASKFMSAPFFLPNTQALSRAEVEAKHKEDKHLRLLFVGHEGRRKSLDLIFEALRAFSQADRERMSFDIVGRLSDGNIDMAIEGVDVRYHTSCPPDRVRSLMEKAHIFIMPSRFESFGLTFIEAMAAGCAIIAPDWEVQRDLLDQGAAGLLTAPEPTPIHSALATLCSERQTRIDLSLNGRDRFLSHYAPQASAQAYFRMIETALQTRKTPIAPP